MSEIVLSAQGMTRRYGGFTAVDDVSIELEKGEIRGLIGPNGAGKSTFMDLICGRGGGYSAGAVSLLGRQIDGMAARHRRKIGLGRSFQKTNIFPELTVSEQLALASPASGADEEVMQELELGHLAERFAGDISYGDQRRLDLALALIGRPPVVLLDEPAAGLSIKESLILSRHLKELTKRWGVTVLIVDHDMDVIFAICDRITVMHLGKILAEGAAKEIQANEEVVRAYLGSAAK
ncbi:MAG: ABC transporter ATP-binding protein [Pseudolabrys sp.]|nr:ABC transporter ATP-binding protein [Pseudolabrys sp.]MDP2295002.1 ABC transporter ATP-binding protein [Pseudolabrys sp.]